MLGNSDARVASTALAMLQTRWSQALLESLSGRHGSPFLFQKLPSFSFYVILKPEVVDATLVPSIIDALLTGGKLSLGCQKLHPPERKSRLRKQLSLAPAFLCRMSFLKSIPSRDIGTCTQDVKHFCYRVACTIRAFNSLLTHSSSELTAGSQFQDLSASKHKYFLVVPNSRAPRIDSRGKGRLCGRCSNIHSLTLTPQAFCKASRLCGQHTLSKRHLRL